MQTFNFLRNIHGTELLVDLGRIETLTNYILDSSRHRITFYEILVITQGAGTFTLDDLSIPLSPGTVVITCPYQVRMWHVAQPVKGFSFFFEADFLNAYFRDPVFIHRFAFFDYTRPSPALDLGPSTALDKCVDVLHDVEAEIRALRGDSSHILRALLYYLIGLLDRVYRQQHHVSPQELPTLVYRFKKLIDRHIRSWHTVKSYTHALQVSANHLTKLTKTHLLATPAEMITQRLVLEAKRDLQFSDQTVSEIAFDLGFSDPSNFNRFFKRHTGQSPRTYRLAK